MTERFAVIFSPRARKHYREARHWWREHNPGAPDRLREDLQEALELITKYPNIGRFAPNVRRPGVRHVPIGKTGYYIYYKVMATRIEVRAVWHVRRGTAPPL